MPGCAPAKATLRPRMPRERLPDGRPEAPADKLADAPRDEAPREEAAPRRATTVEKLRDKIASLEAVIEAVEKRAYDAEAALEKAEERAAVAIEGQLDGPARETKLIGIQNDRDAWIAQTHKANARHKEALDALKTARARIKHLEREVAELRAALGSGDADAREAAE